MDDHCLGTASSADCATVKGTTNSETAVETASAGGTARPVAVTAPSVSAT